MKFKNLHELLQLGRFIKLKLYANWICKITPTLQRCYGRCNSRAENLVVCLFTTQFTSLLLVICLSNYPKYAVYNPIFSVKKIISRCADLLFPFLVRETSLHKKSICLSAHLPNTTICNIHNSISVTTS